MKLHIWITASLTMAQVFMSGCHAGGGPGEIHYNQPAFSYATDEQLPVENCDEVFSPSDEIEELTRKVLLTWSKKTGKSLCIGESGVPVLYEDEVIVDGKFWCGNTNVGYLPNGKSTGANWVTVSRTQNPSCAGYRPTLTHEIGHALSLIPFGASTHLDSSLFGVMSPDSNFLVVPNEHDVKLVCQYSFCTE